MPNALIRPATNIREYESIRRELGDIKRCITDYMGFVFSGSGLSLVGLSLVTSLDVDRTIFVYAPYAISLVLLYVLLILVYKFTSHNFQAGYCKLLNKEVWREIEGGSFEKREANSTRTGAPEIITWEWCVELFRTCDQEPTRLRSFLDELPEDLCTTDTDANGEEHVRSYILDTIASRSPRFVPDSQGAYECNGNKYIKMSPDSNRNMTKRGFSLLRDCMLHARVRSESWKFPVWVIIVFFLLDIIFLGIGLFSTAVEMLTSGWSNVALWVALLFVILTHARLWFYLFGKLHCLMNGSDTIDSAYWRFIPIRNHVLRQFGYELIRV